MKYCGVEWDHISIIDQSELDNFLKNIDSLRRDLFCDFCGDCHDNTVVVCWTEK